MGSTEGAHRATGVEPMSGDRKTLRRVQPDPEVPEKKRRRKFTAKYKLSILSEADLCVEPGQLGALLRREGLYSSHLRDCQSQDKVMLFAFHHLAARRNEIFSIKWPDVDFDNNQIRLWTRKRKGGHKESDWLGT